MKLWTDVVCEGTAWLALVMDYDLERWCNVMFDVDVLTGIYVEYSLLQLMIKVIWFDVFNNLDDPCPSNAAWASNNAILISITSVGTPIKLMKIIEESNL